MYDTSIRTLRNQRFLEDALGCVGVVAPSVDTVRVCDIVLSFNGKLQL